MAASHGRSPLGTVFRLLLLLAGAAIVLLFATSLVLFLLFGRGAVVPKGATLVVRIGGDPPELAPSDVFSYLRGGNALSVRAITAALDRAKQDDRVERLLLEPTGFSSPYWGKVQELRDAVADFETSGKPVYAYLEYAGERDYYLATAADKIFLMPSTTLDITGVATYSLFLRGALDKAGVYPDLHHIGQYKTAVNQFTETGYTDAHREMDQSINDDLFAAFVHDVAAARHKDEAEVRALVDRAPLLPDAARAAGLVDGVAYEDEVEQSLRQASGGSGAGRVEIEDYARGVVSVPSLGFRRRPRIAVIYAAGEITGGESGFDPLNGPAVGSDTLIRYIREARRDDQVKAIVLRVDSPGGSATASDAIWHELMLARNDDPKRPLVASMGDLGASGGYYIAMAANAIVSQPSTLTGSIGIFGGKYVIDGLLAKLGATVEGVAAGRHAGMESTSQRYTPDEVENLDAQLQAFYDQFVGRVAASRGMTKAQVDAVGQGRVWTGRQALQRHLVDELGGLPRAIALARARANIPEGQAVDVVVYPPRKSLFELLSESMSGTTSARAAAWLTADERSALRLLRGPTALFRPGEPLALMPVEYLR
jgi:protease IV